MASSSDSSLTRSPPPKRSKKGQLEDVLSEGVAKLHAINIHTSSVQLSEMVSSELPFDSFNNRILAVTRSDGKYDVVAGKVTIGADSNQPLSVDILDCSKEKAVLFNALKYKDKGWTEIQRLELMRIVMSKFKIGDYGAKMIFAELTKLFRVKLTRNDIKIALCDRRLRTAFVKLIKSQILSSASFDKVNTSFITNSRETLTILDNGLLSGNGAAILQEIDTIGSSLAAYLRGIGYAEPEATRAEQETITVPAAIAKIKSLFPGIGRTYTPNINEIINRVLKSHRATQLLDCKAVTASLSPADSDILLCETADDVIIDSLRDTVVFATGIPTHSKPKLSLNMFGILATVAGEMEEPHGFSITIVKGGAPLDIPTMKAFLYTRGVAKTTLTQDMLTGVFKDQKVYVKSIGCPSVSGVLARIEASAMTFYASNSEKDEIEKVVLDSYCKRVGVTGADE